LLGIGLAQAVEHPTSSDDNSHPDKRRRCQKRYQQDPLALRRILHPPERPAGETLADLVYFLGGQLELRNPEQSSVAGGVEGNRIASEQNDARPEVIVILLRHRADFVRLRHIQILYAEFRQAINLLEKGGVGGIELRYGGGRRSAKDYVAVVMAEIEHSHAKVIASVFDCDVEANTALSRVLDLLVLEYSDDSDCPDHNEQNDDGEANKAPRSCFASSQSDHRLFASIGGAGDHVTTG
jgi:hypothetical protein